MRRVLAFLVLVCLTVTVGAQAPPQTDRELLEQIKALIELHLAPPAPPPPSTIQVAAGENLQAALKAATVAAEAGPVTVVVARGDYVGNFVLPSRSTTGSITVTADPASLPPPGTRITPASSGTLPRLVSASGDQVLVSAPAAHGYTLRGFEVAPLAHADHTAIVLDGDPVLGKNTDPAKQPGDITLDQVLIRGDAVKGLHRGVTLNGVHLAVINSHIDRVFELGRDSQAIATTNGLGPFLVENNYLEASGENYLVGGGTWHLKDIASDITFRRNYVRKDVAWRAMPTQPQVKNLFELKAARHVVVSDNVFEFNWLQAQTGWSILLTCKTNASVSEPFLEIRDVVFTRNIVRHVASGVNIGAQDGPVIDVRIVGNLFADMNKTTYGGDGKWLQTSTGIDGLELGHNTVVAMTGSAFLTLYADAAYPQVSRLDVHHVVVPEKAYGIFTTGGLGQAALDILAKGARFVDNAIGDDPTRAIKYAAGNFLIPSGTYPAQFTPEFAIAPGSTLAGFTASDAATLGVDVTTLPRE
jgi:hypothetical protein